MNTQLFEKFNSMFGDIAKDVAEAANANKKVERKEVPYGDYEVKITKLELGECTFDGDYKGYPEAHVWFKIISEGEYNGQMLFMNKRLISLKNPSANGFIIHKFNEFLTSLEPSVPVSFENWGQYAALMESIFNEIDGRAEYQLAYFDNKGWKDYQIVQRFV
jgi:hypothetical protein